MTAEQIRDACLEWLDEHKRNCPNGLDCREPASFIAFLCHSLRVRSMNEVYKYLIHYELECTGCEAHEGKLRP